MKKSFYPCKNWIGYQLWQISGKPFSKYNQKYIPHKGDIGILKELANQSIYPPILDLIIDNLKKTDLPEVIKLKDKKIPIFGSLLYNSDVMQKIMVTTNMGLSAKDQHKFINNGSFAGELTLDQIINFRHYFWCFPDGQRKIANEALISIKNPSKFVQLYREFVNGNSSEGVLFFYINQSRGNSHLVEISRNTINYEADKLQKYSKIYNMDMSEQRLRILKTILNIEEKNMKIEEG